MICLTRNKFKFYKKIVVDIWGHYPFYGRPNKIMTFIRIMKNERKARKWYYRKNFIYSYKKRMRYQKKKYQTNEFVFPRILKHYYLVLKLDHFRRFRLKAMKQVGSYQENYLNFIEGRLFMLLYRSNFVTNLFMLKSLMELGIFLINNKRKYHTHVYTRPGDIVSVLPQYFFLLRNDLLMRLEQDMIVRKVPYYMEVNFKLMFIFCLSKPRLRNIKYPLNDIDVYIGVDYVRTPKIS